MQPTYNIDNPNLPYQTKLDLWQTGFGLQQVDGLTPSAYMEELAEKQARGDYSYEQVYEEIIDYHKSTDNSTAEADLVSLRIAELLSRSGFSFSPAALLTIHRELFQDIFDESIPIGQFRQTNISKKETVLNGESTLLAGSAYFFFHPGQKIDIDQLKLIPQLFGWGSAILYCCSRIPQIMQNFRNESVEGLSLVMFIFSVVGNLTYCIVSDKIDK